MATPTIERSALGRAKISARSLRTDRWWMSPLFTFAGLTAWVLYALVRTATQADYYWAPGIDPEGPGGYLSPFTSPCVFSNCAEGASHFGQLPIEVPAPIPLGLLVLPFLLGFRLTCYYYRKAYYRSFWLSPPSCAVGEPHGRYSGETRFPLILQNSHRYFFYFALIVSLINTYDAIIAFSGASGFHFGLGNLILIGNVVLLWAYTISCHSCRHIMGGRLNHFSRHPLRYRLWGFISRLNTRHMQLAWITLGTLLITDAYIGLVSAGIITDLRFVN